MKKTVSIAIDGPSGAGKSTISKILAKRLGFLHVDTGALYRAAGLAALRAGLRPGDEEGISALVRDIDIRLAIEDGVQKTLLDGEDVSGQIRNETVSKYASAASAYPAVRARLLETQRAIARENSVIMDGRDIGTVVLPDADLKIYLTADSEDRARRRMDEYGGKQEFRELLAAVEARDRADSTREHAPLRRHPDAVLADTTGNTLEQSVELLETIIRERLRLVL